MRAKLASLAAFGMVLAPCAFAQGVYDDLIVKHAAANDVPESLIRRVIHIESRGNAKTVHRGNYGLMQIRLGTARAMGYEGGPAGLLDADTNMKFAVKYLAGAYRAAGCNADRAVSYYQRGYVHAHRAKCNSPAPFVLAQAEAKSVLPADVLKPKIIQTLSITSSEERQPTPPAKLDTAPTAPQSDTFADRMLAATAASPATTGTRSDLEPEALPAAEVRKTTPPPAQPRGSRAAARKIKKHSSPEKQPPVESSDAPARLISMLKKLVQTDSKTHARAHNAKAEALR